MIHVDWGNHEETLMVVKFSGTWNADEFTQAMNRAYRVSATKPYHIALFLDMQTASIAPKNIMLRTAQVFSQTPPNVNQILIISRSPIWKHMWGLVSRIYRIESLSLYFVNDANEAYELVPSIA